MCIRMIVKIRNVFVLLGPQYKHILVKGEYTLPHFGQIQPCCPNIPLKFTSFIITRLLVYQSASSGLYPYLQSNHWRVPTAFVISFISPQPSYDIMPDGVLIIKKNFLVRLRQPFLNTYPKRLLRLPFCTLNEIHLSKLCQIFTAQSSVNCPMIK